MSATQKRAVRTDQKEARRETIMHAALALFADSDFETVSMAAIARTAGIAKGTVYLYFDTKEALFLAVVSGIFDGQFNRIDRNLLDLPPASTAEMVVAAIGAAMDIDPNSSRLTALTHSVIERNVSFETVLEFKQSMRRRLVYSGSLIEEKLSFLAPGKGARLLMTMHALFIGLQQMADPAPTAKAVLERPEMDLFRVDTASYMAETMLALLKGLKAA